VHDGAAQSWADGENPLIPRPEDIERFMDLVLERPPPVGKAVIRYVITQRAARADSLHKLFRASSITVATPASRASSADRSPDADHPRRAGSIISKSVAEDLVTALRAASWW
jgi:hypothetical protein